MKKRALLVIFILTILLVVVNYRTQMEKIEVGDKVPTFTLKDQNGKAVTINDTQ